MHSHNTDTSVYSWVTRDSIFAHCSLGQAQSLPQHSALSTQLNLVHQPVPVECLGELDETPSVFTFLNLDFMLISRSIMGKIKSPTAYLDL